MRGQTVQGGSVALRKAPLRSMVYPWSTKRHCGPLAFRRATEGSRVQRRVWGCQEGAREPYGALAPSCLRRETPAPPAAGRRHFPPAVGTAFPSPPGDPGNPPAAGRRHLSPPGDPGNPPPWVRRERGWYRQAVQLSDHFLPVFLSTLAFFANLRKWFAYFDCFARFSKKFLLQK